MNKKLFLCFAVALCSCRLSAQILTLTLGPSVPLGAFGSKDPGSNNSGLAHVGPVADFGYQHPFGHSHFGWVVTLRGRANGLDNAASEAPFQTQYPGYQWSANHSYWTSVSALGGGYYAVPLTRVLSLTASIELGVAEVWAPKQSVTGELDSVGFGVTNLVQVNLHPASATTFTALASLGIHYKLNNRWNLLASVGFTYLQPDFKNLTETVIYAQHFAIPGFSSIAYASEVNYSSYTKDYKQPMSSLDFTFGVGWALCRKSKL